MLHQHPAVSKAQVIGVPSRKYGEEVMAWVRLAPGAAATEEDLAPVVGNVWPPTSSRAAGGSSRRFR